jgi:hypothetical protein
MAIIWMTLRLNPVVFFQAVKFCLRKRLGSGTPLLNTPLATTPPYQPHAEAPLSATRTCYRDPDVSNGYHFVYLHEFSRHYRQHTEVMGFFFFLLWFRKSRISIVNFFNYIQVKGGGKAGNGMPA